MTTFSFWTPGVPVAKARPRFGNGRTYKDAKTEQAEATILTCYLMCPDRPRRPHEGPVILDTLFLFPRPKSWPKWRQALEGVPHLGRPDLDNLVKGVMDAINGVCFCDDKQVYSGVHQKRYVNVDEAPGTLVTVWLEDAVERGER